MSKLPSRGPRVMHGMGKLLQQARSLLPAGHKNGGVLPAGPAQAQTMGLEEHAARMADLAVLAQRCTDAERRVAKVKLVNEVFTKQLEQLPEKHPMRTVATQMLDTYREAIK